jgi:glycosyltransferase involved in cell wall biosynthesis
MKALVLILTSSKFNLLKRCIESVENQRKVNYKWELKIVVNTLNEEYYEKVKNEITNYEVIRTESNGRPGKGHNSLYYVFRMNEKFDYMFYIDGDDLFYPTAFQQYETIIKNNPNVDLVHLMLNDNISYVEKPNLKNFKLKHKFKLYSSANEHKNWWKYLEVKNPFVEKIEDCKTPTRILVVSRKVLDSRVRYSEQLKLYDDFLSFLTLTEAQRNNELNTLVITDSNIYLYNAVNDHSVSHIFKDTEYENRIFKEETADIIHMRDWDLLKLPFYECPIADNFTLQQKVDFCNKYYVDFEIKEKMLELQSLLTYENGKITINEKTLDRIKYIVNICHAYGIENKLILELLYQTNLMKNDYGLALYYLEKLGRLNPSLKNYSRLFNFTHQIRFYEKSYYYGKIMLRYTKNEQLEKIIELYQKKVYENEHYKLTLFKKGLFDKIKLDQSKKIVCYYTGYSPEFNGEDYGEKKVWGSEIAAIKLCEELAKWYNVFIFCPCSKVTKYNEVYYYNLGDYNLFEAEYSVDYLIVSRYLHFFLDFNINAKKVMMILHDTRGHSLWNGIDLPEYGLKYYENIIDKIDHMLFVSEWQKENFENIMKGGNNNKYNSNTSFVLGNGFDPLLFTNEYKRTEKRFISSSDTTRGLLFLCKIFPEIVKQHPEAYLDIYYSHISPEIQEYVNKYNYIKFNGKISQKELAIELQKSDIWFYPNVYSHETFCMAALEAMAAGNIVITGNNSGLKTTVGEGGILLDELNEEKCISLVNNLLNDNNLKNVYRKKAIEQSKKFDWKIIGKKMKMFLDEL